MKLLTANMNVFRKNTRIIPLFVTTHYGVTLKLSHSSGASGVTGLVNNGVAGIILLRHTSRVIRNDCRGSNNCHLVLQMQPHVISFYGVTSGIRLMFLLFPQVSRNWRYESEPPLKPSTLTCCKQFGTNSIIVLMFVESQTVHIYSTCKVRNKNLGVLFY